MMGAKYSDLQGLFACTYYADGLLKSCKCTEKNRLHTPVGMLTPKYEMRETRDRDRAAVEFYKSGQLKSVYLNELTKIKTTVGVIECEFLTFYESGCVHRLFPTYGKVSGMWSEEEEINLTPKIFLNIGNISIKNKLSCICFYETGQIKSISLYPGEIMKVNINQKEMEVRIGISFYEDGNIRSLEPAIPSVMNTPIGKVIAYNTQPIGVHGDDNSIKFDEDGVVSGIMTVQSGIEVTDADSSKFRIQPVQERSLMDLDTWEMVPMELLFQKDGIKIMKNNQEIQFLDSKTHTFDVFYNDLYKADGCGHSCSSCSGCATTSQTI